MTPPQLFPSMSWFLTKVAARGKSRGLCGGTQTWYQVEMKRFGPEINCESEVRKGTSKRARDIGYILCQASIASSWGDFWRHRFNMHSWRFWISFRRLSNSKKMGWNPELSPDTPKTTPPLREYLIPQLDSGDDPFIFFGKSGETKKNPQKKVGKCHLDFSHLDSAEVYNIFNIFYMFFFGPQEFVDQRIPKHHGYSTNPPLTYPLQK